MLTQAEKNEDLGHQALNPAGLLARAQTTELQGQANTSSPHSSYNTDWVIQLYSGHNTQQPFCMCRQHPIIGVNQKYLSFREEPILTVMASGDKLLAGQVTFYYAAW